MSPEFVHILPKLVSYVPFCSFFQKSWNYIWSLPFSSWVPWTYVQIYAYHKSTGKYWKTNLKFPSPSKSCCVASLWWEFFWEGWMKNVISTVYAIFMPKLYISRRVTEGIKVIPAAQLKEISTNIGQQLYRKMFEADNYFNDNGKGINSYWVELRRQW